MYLLFIFLLSFADPFSVGKACRAKLAEIQQNAELLLEEVSRKEGVRQIKPGKLYFKTLKEGNGSIPIKPTDAPTIRYTSYVMEGEEDLPCPLEDPKKVRLEYCFPGLRDGITGMTKGEIRRIYIHPELTHGKYGPLAPYGLNFYDVELIENE